MHDAILVQHFHSTQQFAHDYSGFKLREAEGAVSDRLKQLTTRARLKYLRQASHAHKLGL